MKISDNQDEIFDVVDSKDRVIGKTTRKEANSDKNLIHRSAYVLVFNKKGELFFQQRSKSKDTDPLKWTVSCSGHVLAGDNYEVTAHRELIEELGVDLPINYIDTFTVRLPKECEMTAVFKAKSNGPFKLHPLEIKRGRFFSQDRLRRAIQNKSISLSLSAKCVLDHIHWL